MNKKISIALITVVLAFMLIAFGFTETDNSNGNDGIEVTGEQLSRIYCTMCHKYPEPNLLDKKSWREYMLPRMKFFLGAEDSDSLPAFLFEKGIGGDIVKNANVFPQESFFSNPEDWDKIVDYYIENAPDSLIVKPLDYNYKLNEFTVIKPTFSANIPSTTMLKFSAGEGLYLGDANTQLLYHFDKNGNPDKSVKIKEGVVWLEEIGSDIFVTTMGSFAPTDAPVGLLTKFDMAQGGKSTILIDSLQRPVHSAVADLTDNGLQDIVVCEFAKWTGGLSFHENMGNGTYKKKYLRKDPGATKAYIHDFNNDSLPDIIALFAQGDEAIYIYYNKGAGKFEEKRVLRFDASYGSSYFNIFDYDNDKDMDLIFTAGDNADFKPILKPYHGIYIFENDGENNFKEVFFQQLNGAYAAHPADYDKDGDLDIAAISFFPDYAGNPNEGFVYYKNKGGLKMEAFTFENIELGRWIIMDTGDFDNDGDKDIAIGSLMFEITPDTCGHYMKNWLENKIPFLILKNNTQ